MLKNTFKLLLPLLFLILLGCSATSSVPVYNNSSNRYIRAMDLPADYPTKYLPDGNMWNDFKKNLQLPVDTSNPYVKAQIRWYQNHQSFLNNSIQRGAPFLYYAYQQTKKNNLPAELALIPIGESGFIPSNKSNKGAVGLWQFMPSTAREFNLKVNKYYDGRRDPIASTDAALKYFTYLHYYFDNDWLLAIAAYDTGPGNVQKAQFRNQRQNLPTKDFWSLNLHNETREYIPKILALSAIIKNPKKYGVYLTPVNDALYFEQINVGHQIALTEVAKLSDSKTSTIKFLNPALLQGVTQPTGPHIVLVPKSKSSGFKKRVNGSSAEPEETIPAPATTQTITTSALPEATSAVPQQQQTSAEEENTAATATVNQPQAEKAEPEEPAYIKYKVKKKENLSKIARKYGTSEKTLRKINKLRNNSIKVGQTLLVPNPDKGQSSASTESNDAANTTVSEQSTNQEIPKTQSQNLETEAVKTQTKNTTIKETTATEQETSEENRNQAIRTFNYTVTPTDTIYSISRKFNTSPDAVQKINHLQNYKIKPGQVIKIQGNSATTSSKSKKKTKKVNTHHPAKSAGKTSSKNKTR